jgi:membrane-associated phospholipid phosphatase
MESALNLARTAPRFLLVGAGRYLSILVRELPASIRRQQMVLGIIMLYWMGGLMVGHLAGIPPSATVMTYLPTYMATMPIMIIVLLLGRGLLIMTCERPKQPLTQLLREIRTTFATPQRIAHALPILIGMVIFGGTFTVVKASIPFLSPFSWDTTFEELDRLLHGGVAPWQLLQPLLGEPLITVVINWAYTVWFYFVGFIWVWQAFRQGDDRLRQRFFLTLTLGWSLLGNVAAILFASGGPCYFGRITGLPDPFLPLMSYLHSANEIHQIWSLRAQDMLWQNYSGRELTLGAGISAMPSMHVAMATLFALLCWQIKRWVGIAMAIFAVIVMLGSVHLGWHYAVDGYVGALGMFLVWWIVGRVIERQNTAPAIAIASNSTQ